MAQLLTTASALSSSSPSLLLILLVLATLSISVLVPTATATAFVAPSSSFLHRHQHADADATSSPTTRRSLMTPVVSLSSSSSEAAETASSIKQSSVTNKIPVHLLAGFLGSGKTTTLKHILENTEGYKIGVIVNDIAAINIDAKLINQQQVNSNSTTNTVQGGVVELQNGCACCSLADELLTSIETILNSSGPDQSFDAVIVELSGVADPVAIQNNWKQAVSQNLSPAVTDAAELGNVITVVDACTFGSDYMTWDVAGRRKEWFDTPDDCTVNRMVVELLAEQVEAADILIVNKQDLAGPDQVAVTESMVRSLNDQATFVTTSFGKVTVKDILQTAASAASALEEEEKDTKDCVEPDCTDTSHAHAHAHDDHACAEPDCTDTSHSHSHDDHACAEPDCTDASHSHSHDDHACAEPDCTDASHSHSHAHDDHACGDPDCTDETHSHSHDDTQKTTANTSTDNLGIGNFVYKATKPFDADRLMQLLYKWPVPIKDELDLSLLKDAATNGYHIKDTDEDADEPISPFVGVLRSKGFCWFSPVHWDGVLEDTWRHNVAMYWSHAGKHIGIQEAGRWWHSMPEQSMLDFFATNAAEYERIRRDDFVTDEFGDRRQELVFIGIQLREEAITTALDACLLSDAEFADYREELKKIVEMPMEVQQ